MLLDFGEGSSPKSWTLEIKPKNGKPMTLQSQAQNPKSLHEALNPQPEHPKTLNLESLTPIQNRCLIGAAGQQTFPRGSGFRGLLGLRSRVISQVTTAVSTQNDPTYEHGVTPTGARGRNPAAALKRTQRTEPPRATPAACPPGAAKLTRGLENSPRAG